ncbi:MAG: transporter substrate-binding domain-containing protein [Pseudodesulfovibrio sp.]
MRTLLLTALLSLTLLAGPARARAVKFVSDLDFAPYSMLIDGKPAGIDVEVLQAAADKAGITLEIELKPWEQLMKMVAAGTCDGAFALFRSPEREKIALFMEAMPVHVSDYVLFTLVGDTFPFGSYDDLAGKTVGKVRGISLGDEFDQAAAAGKVAVREYPDLSSGLRGLLQGEVNAYAGNIDVTYYRLKAMGMTSSITYLTRKLAERQPAYLVMSRASDLEEKEEILQRLGIALDTMHKDGSYNRIAKRYLFRF